MRLPLFVAMASAGLVACSGGGDTDQSAAAANANNIPSAGAAVLEERELPLATGSSSLTPPPTSAKDPGPRGGTRFAGGPLPNLTGPQLAAFNAGQADFDEAEDGRRRPRADDEPRQLRRLPLAARDRRHEPGGQPAGRVRHEDRRDQQLPSFIRAERAGARGALRAQRRRHARRRRACAVHHHRAAPARPAAASRSPTSRRSSRNNNVIFRIPTPVFGAGPDRADPRLDDPRQPGGASAAKQSRSASAAGRTSCLAFSSITGSANQQRQRRHHRALRLEGAEQVAAALLGRGLQRRDGHHQRAFPTERDENRRLPVRDACPTAYTDTRRRARPPRAERDREVRVLHALPRAAEPSADEPGGSHSIARGRSASAATGCALCHTPTLRTGNSQRRRAAQQDRRTCSPTCWCTTWAPGSPTASRRARRAPREFRTAPLWGLGQRIFFLHDGRTSRPDARRSAARQATARKPMRWSAASCSCPTHDAAGPAQLPAFAVARTRRGFAALISPQRGGGSPQGTRPPPPPLPCSLAARLAAREFACNFALRRFRPASRAARLRRQRVRLDRRRGHLVRAARRLRRRRLQPDRHRRRLFALGPGHSGGESETMIGHWLKRAASATARARHQGRHGHGRRPHRPVAALHPPGGRRFAAPAADRPHRPLPVARGRRQDAARRDARRLRRPDREGKVRAIGASNYTAARLAEALETSARRGCRATSRCSRCTT